jgi:hypothetical protein
MKRKLNIPVAEVVQRILLLCLSLLSFQLLAQPAIEYSDAQTGKVHDFIAVRNGEEIWMAAENGIFRFFEDGDPLQIYTPYPSIAEAISISRISTSSSNEVIYVGGQGYAAWTNDYGVNWNVLHSGNSNLSSSDTVLQAVANPQSDIWVRVDEQVMRQQGNQFQASGYFSPSIAIAPTTCCELYLADQRFTDPPVFKFVGPAASNWVAMNTPYQPPLTWALQNNYASKIMYSGNELWYASLGALYRYNNGTWLGYLMPFNLTANTFFAPIGDSCLGVNGFNFIAKEDTAYKCLNPLLASFSHMNDIKEFEFFDSTLYLHKGDQVFQILANKIHAKGNTVGIISPNNISSYFSSTGFLFGPDDSDNNGNARFHFDNASAFFAGQLWYRGLRNNIDTVTNLETFRQVELQNFSGPISNVYDRAYLQKYDKVWVVSKAEILLHKQQYLNPTYSTPTAIRTWPGNGDVSKGEAAILAPFEDHNFNGIYEPHFGEVPEIRGDETAYFIFNDSRGHFGGSGLARPGEIEVHCMAYGYNSSTSEGLRNTLFLSYRIVNRSSSTIHDFEPFMWFDGDLGNGNDDLVGSDSIRKEIYFYNADLNDEGLFGYGINPPAIGVHFLSEPITGCFSNDNNYTSNNSLTFDPSTLSEYWSRMNLEWSDGNPLVVQNPSGLADVQNGIGYDPNGNFPRTKWHYNHAANWYSSPSTLADKRCLARAGKYNLQAGQEICFDLAITAGRDNTPVDIGSSLNVVKSNLDEVKQFYANGIFNCLNFGMNTTDVDASSYMIYPNPISAGTNLVIIHNGQKLVSAEIVAVDGRVVLKTNDFKSDDKSSNLMVPANLAESVYLLQLMFENGRTHSERLMVF